jgi:hypothetical protein
VNELTIPGQITPTSLILSPATSFDDWQSIGGTLQTINAAHQWWIGDWLLFGEIHYGDRYAQAVELTKLSYGSIANIVWTARNVDLTRRRENLSFAHHSEVAPLEPDEQEHWLALAEANEWSRDQLRDEIRKSREFPPLTQREELERANGKLKSDLRQARASVAALEAEAEREMAEDPLGPAYEAWERDRGNPTVTCPHCGRTFEVEA